MQKIYLPEVSAADTRVMLENKNAKCFEKNMRLSLHPLFRELHDRLFIFAAEGAEKKC